MHLCIKYNLNTVQTCMGLLRPELKLLFALWLLRPDIQVKSLMALWNVQCNFFAVWFWYLRIECLYFVHFIFYWYVFCFIVHNHTTSTLSLQVTFRFNVKMLQGTLGHESCLVMSHVSGICCIGKSETDTQKGIYLLFNSCL